MVVFAGTNGVVTISGEAARECSLANLVGDFDNARKVLKVLDVELIGERSRSRGRAAALAEDGAAPSESSGRASAPYRNNCGSALCSTHGSIMAASPCVCAVFALREAARVRTQLREWCCWRIYFGRGEKFANLGESASSRARVGAAGAARAEEFAEEEIAFFVIEDGTATVAISCGVARRIKIRGRHGLKIRVLRS
jgi:hypothetical protein